MELPLNPIAFHIGPIAVHWYGIFMAISIGIGMYYLYKKAIANGYDDDFITNLLLLVVICGVIGARLMFVLTNTPQWFINDPLQILKVYQGGLSWHGAVLGGFLAGLWYCRKKGKRINPLEDYAVVGLAVGNILVRIGNIFNHEVLGRTTIFAFRRWPDQLIGVSIGIILLIRYFYLQKKGVPEGYQFWSFIFYYQLIRGVVEETFKDTPLLLPIYYNRALGIGLLTTTQVVTPFILLLAYWMMVRVKKDAQIPN
ncbi:phosphatidylglycerol:prolipoprotein diacylglycerol transferase [Caldanaerobius fijiensis DSM 17918]|uniref:Phosphatidylglycerol--prolipoprotein diacylglyceryl transferase n=1 Tax=Caldanaerobius fijiensis DSM 17918 TaxID=1121256 RepID=A0A1M4T5J1_9THEO|nr:prolipoprotein diacylglyceryl transferase [Caldanaerobius fijiensis]SHE39803.1 phosphatidylglycerol:prolipoprotein diacylglycerol transferase [Caldanaerobius fijiensis DSM 17918]